MIKKHLLTCWIMRWCSRSVGSVCSVRKCLSVYRMDCRSSESCLLDKILDIAVMCVYVPYNTITGEFRVSYNNVLNKIFWSGQLHQGVKSLQSRRQQHLEDGDGVSP